MGQAFIRDCYAGFRRMNSRGGFTESEPASATLERLLVENYESVKDAYLNAPSAESKAAFIALFDDDLSE